MIHKFQVNKRIIASFNQKIDEDSLYDSGDYIFDIQNTSDKSKLISSLSNNHLLVYDSESLQLIRDIPSHDFRINNFEASRYNSDTVICGYDDGTVKFYDLRSSSDCIMSCMLKDEVYDVSLGLGGLLLGVGSGNTLSFMDPRQMTSKSLNILAEYSDIHSDIITQVQFNSKYDSILASGSEDGLVCTMNTSVGVDEETVMSIMNTESPVRKLNFFGEDNAGLFVLSTIETLNMYHHMSAQRIGQFLSIRNEFTVDYLVDCFHDELTDDLYLIAGQYDGNGIILTVEPTMLSMFGNLNDGHSATIRSCLGDLKRLVSGGEDSRVCSWSLMNDDSIDVQNRHNSSNLMSNKVLSTSNKKSMKALRNQPY